jgi:hypothetical protein
MDLRQQLSRWAARKPDKAADTPASVSFTDASGGVASGPNARPWAAVQAFLSDAGSPRHALLIDGPWGVGKTHFQAAIMRVFGAGKVWLYVSLYGVSSKSDIDNAVFSALYPVLTGNGAAVVGALGNAALNFVNIELKIDPKALFDRKSIDVIVFDDLERSSLPAAELLGYINNYVEHEHEGLKVILLANMAEMADQVEFQRTREKVVGRTIRIEPDFKAAFPAFLKNVRDPEVRSQLAFKEDVFENRFLESKVGNLRLVQQAVSDIGRLAEVMEPTHRENTSLFSAVVELILILSIELRSGGIQVGEIVDRRNQWIHGAIANEANPIRRLSEKYPGAPLVEAPLSDDVLHSLLIDGVVDAERVKADLNQSRWFVSDQEAAWRRVWRSHELPDAIVEPAIEEMNQLYDTRGYHLAGEILHVLGQRLWLADIGRIPLTRAEVEIDGRAYIDAVRDAGVLEPHNRDDFIRNTGYDGLGYTQAETEEFRRLAAYLSDQRTVADQRRRPDQAAELFNELKGDFELFTRRILHNGGSDSRWSRTAILNHLDPEAVSGWLIEQHPAVQREVLMSLSIRYDHDALNRDLADERPWLDALRTTLERQSANLPPVARDRLVKNIKWFIAPKLDGAESEQQ